MAQVGVSRLCLEVFKSEQEKLFVLISITSCANSVATYASLDQILCLNHFDAVTAIWQVRNQSHFSIFKKILNADLTFLLLD